MTDAAAIAEAFIFVKINKTDSVLNIFPHVYVPDVFLCSVDDYT